jgi:hypothetical protein
MLNKVLAGLAAAVSVAVVGFARADGPRVPQHNPYAGIYEKSLGAMRQPDQSLDRVLAPDSDWGLSEVEPYVAQSRTCSQRCSTRCSTTCTTTRGCSTLCKKQTDGCGGTVAPPPTTNPATLTGRLPSGVYLASDLTGHSVVNAQRALVVAGYTNLCVDGSTSAAFSEALRDYQARNGLPATGQLTAETWAALDVVLARAVGR